jgi:hypothetical protein
MAKKEKVEVCEVSLAGCYGDKVSYDALREFLSDVFEDNRYAEERDCDERFAACIWGVSGCGKTAITKQFRKIPVEWDGKTWDGYRVIDVPLAQFEEMGDLHGMPSKHIYMTHRNGTIREKWVPEEVASAYLSDGWQIRPEYGIRTMYAPPDWVPTDERPTILLLDDWNRASQRIIKGVMQLLQNYGMVSWKLPRGCNIVLTANPDEQEYLVTSLDPAILTRIKSITLKHDAKEWAVWAARENLDHRLVSFVLQYPEMMIGKERTNPRTLAELGRVLRKFKTISSTDEFRRFRTQALSLLDEETVTSMIVFMERDVELVLRPEQILDGDPSVAPHVKKLMTAKEKRIDVLSVMCERLYAHILNPSVKPTPKLVANFQSFLCLPEVPDDIRFGICLRIHRSNAGMKWINGCGQLTDLILKVV